jgi:hypothetical protein
MIACHNICTIWWECDSHYQLLWLLRGDPTSWPLPASQRQIVWS